MSSSIPPVGGKTVWSRDRIVPADDSSSTGETISVHVIKGQALRFPRYSVSVARTRGGLTQVVGDTWLVPCRFDTDAGPGVALVARSLLVLADLLQAADAFIRTDASREANSFNVAKPTDKMTAVRPVTLRLEDGTFVSVPGNRKPPIPRDD